MIRQIIRPLFIAIILCPTLLSAQTSIPYSRYGLGLLEHPEPAFLRGWGSLSAAYHNPFNINYLNPASYGYLTYTVFETGLYLPSSFSIILVGETPLLIK